MPWLCVVIGGLHRTYTGFDGAIYSDEVERGPVVVQIPDMAIKNAEAGRIYYSSGEKIPQCTEGMWKFLGVGDDGVASWQEACPTPGCLAPVTHRSLHHIPSGLPKGATS